MAEPDAADRHPQADDLGGQIVRFASIGLASTFVFSVLFAALRPAVGPVTADLTALAATAVANMAAHRRLTFGHRGHPGRSAHHGGALGLAVLPLAVNLGALVVAGRVGIDSTPGLIGTLALANGVAAAYRFLVLRRRFGISPTPARPPATQGPKPPARTATISDRASQDVAAAPLLHRVDGAR